MSFEITGKIDQIFKEQQVSDRFKKREFVIEKEEKGFTELLKFQLVQDKTDLIEPYNMGDVVTVHFNLKGNKWKDSYFVNLNAWRISKDGGSNNQNNSAPTPPPAQDNFSDMPPPPGEDEMPF